jgi:hypothetical protein
MSEEKPKFEPVPPQQPSPEEFAIGFDQTDPNMMMVQIPINRYAEEGDDGMDMFYGKMKRVEAIGAKIIREKRIKKAKGGILSPNGMKVGSA